MSTNRRWQGTDGGRGQVPDTGNQILQRSRDGSLIWKRREG